VIDAKFENRILVKEEMVQWQLSKSKVGLIPQSRNHDTVEESMTTNKTFVGCLLAASPAVLGSATPTKAQH
jgi:hypothetical protein